MPPARRGLRALPTQATPSGLRRSWAFTQGVGLGWTRLLFQSREGEGVAPGCTRLLLQSKECEGGGGHGGPGAGPGPMCGRVTRSLLQRDMGRMASSEIGLRRGK